MDMWTVDLQRFSPHFGSPSFLRERVQHVVETYFMIPYPHKEYSAGRGLRLGRRVGTIIIGVLCTHYTVYRAQSSVHSCTAWCPSICVYNI